MEQTAKLMSVSDEAKRRVLKFENLGTIADFKDKDGHYRFSDGLVAGKTYKVGFIEKTVAGYDKPFKNLSAKPEEVAAQPSQTQGPQRDDGYWMQKDRAMTRLGCLRDAIAYMDILQRSGQLQKVELKMLEALTNAFVEGIMANKEPISFDYDKFFISKVEEEAV